MSLYRKLVIQCTRLYAAERELESARATLRLHPLDKQSRKQFENALRRVSAASEQCNRARAELVEQAFAAARKEPLQ